MANKPQERYGRRSSAAGRLACRKSRMMAASVVSMMKISMSAGNIFFCLKKRPVQLKLAVKCMMSSVMVTARFGLVGARK